MSLWWSASHRFSDHLTATADRFCTQINIIFVDVTICLFWANDNHTSDLIPRDSDALAEREWQSKTTTYYHHHNHVQRRQIINSAYAVDNSRAGIAWLSSRVGDFKMNKWSNIIFNMTPLGRFTIYIYIRTTNDVEESWIYIVCMWEAIIFKLKCEVIIHDDESISQFKYVFCMY